MRSPGRLLFTAVTLGCGFKGGEVTPLFFIGATLGCTLGAMLGVPVDFLAALGFVAVFAGAANTPLACTIMGIELFGGAVHGVSGDRLFRELRLVGPPRHLSVADRGHTQDRRSACSRGDDSRAEPAKFTGPGPRSRVVAV